MEKLSRVKRDQNDHVFPNRLTIHSPLVTFADAAVAAGRVFQLEGSAHRDRSDVFYFQNARVSNFPFQTKKPL